MSGVLMLGPVALVVLLVLLVALMLRTRVADDDVAWLTGSAAPPADEALVVARYLARHRAHRVVGGVVGVVLALVVAVRWAGQLRVGVGGITPLADPLFLGLGGVILGALLAESFRVPRAAGPAVASLQPRDTATGSGHLRTARAVAGLAVVIAGAQALAAPDAAATSRSLTALLLGLAVVALAELTRRTVIDRRRTALSDRARRLDERLRGFAVASLARLELAAASLTAAWAFTAVTLPGVTSDVAAQALAAAQAAAALAGLVVAVVQLRRARPRPPRGWAPEAFA